MIVSRQQEFVPLKTPGGNHTSVLATGLRGSTEISVLQQEQEAGGSNPLHYHDHEEVMLLLSGTASVVVDEEKTELNAGDVLTVPANSRHSVSNAGDDVARWMLVSVSSIRYFKPNGEEIVPLWVRSGTV